MPTPVDVEARLKDFNENGYTILEDAIEPELVTEIVTAIDRLERELVENPSLASGPQQLPERKNFDGPHALRITGEVLALEEFFPRAAAHPAVLAMADAILGPQCLLATAITLVLGPGQPRQVLHVDDMYLPLPRPHQALSVNFIWALTDFTAENGATRVVPGSHLWAEEFQTVQNLVGVQNQDAYETVPAEMKQGSVFVMHGSLVHGGGSNTSDARRYGMAMDYCQGWIRQRENLQHGVPMKTLRTYPPRVQELIGVRGKFGGSVGNIGLLDPAEVLFA
jgi:ectoine hydroxylase-related dioxygenase (phytanoyl-CoA dioxygenase family)